MSDRIVPLAEEHFEGVRRALDVVAREKRYLAFQAAPPPAVAEVFYRTVLANRSPHYVAIVDDDVAGWCDVLRNHGEARSHVGTLGIGLVPAARGRGLGTALMRTAIARSWEIGFSRIELTVRVDNRAAQALYRRLGFVEEGTLLRAFRVDDTYFDAYAMALLR
ncbi:MAG: GNAT family N-acetyltransferase [Alphaproteobacteria bacterium]|nr:GNAT family N-acetyltransferase [Alphaproteobacteria bacterium]